MNSVIKEMVGKENQNDIFKRTRDLRENVWSLPATYLFMIGLFGLGSIYSRRQVYGSV